MSRETKRPWWVILMVTATICTVFTVPLMVSMLPAGMGIFIVFYPVVALISGIVCWVRYPTPAHPAHRDIYWTLMLVTWMSFGLMFLSLL